jgi:hypothetical protein
MLLLMFGGPLKIFGPNGCPSLKMQALWSNILHCKLGKMSHSNLWFNNGTDTRKKSMRDLFLAHKAFGM